ncbi:MAG: isopenicillin N synthase family oxygenase [Leptolyngbyaceae cyanobacterium RM2_2_4]|nr:isopenicillin N synthase family oxygenase [Leptolyngbyaceae cyanobacterium RM2_2_4]
MEVKVADLRSNNFEKDLINSVIGTGFVVVTRHGIDDSLIRNAQQGWREFFLKEQMYKNLFINGNNGNMGYKGMRTETAVGAKKADLKEFFHWKPGHLMPQDVWQNTLYLFHQLEDVAGRILRVIDDENKRQGDYTNYADDCYQSDNTILRTLYYPAMDFGSDPDAVRAAAHEDINHITLLVAASAPGLQVLDKKGNWHDVPHEENSIVVNIGDMMQLASQGRYKSTTHRVVNPNNNREDRISMPLFVHPASHVLLAPGVTAGQFLQERIAEIYGAKK